MELREYKKRFEDLYKELKSDLGTNKDMIITIKGTSDETCPGYTIENISVSLEAKM